MRTCLLYPEGYAQIIPNDFIFFILMTPLRKYRFLEMSTQMAKVWLKLWSSEMKELDIPLKLLVLNTKLTNIIFLTLCSQYTVFFWSSSCNLFQIQISSLLCCAMYYRNNPQNFHLTAIITLNSFCFIKRPVVLMKENNQAKIISNVDFYFKPTKLLL